MRLDRMMALAAMAALLLGCPGDDKASSSSSGSGGAGGGYQPDPPPISGKATVKFKARDRLVNELAQALTLPPDQVCVELGQYACADVHAIALGGVDAYGAGIYEPLKASAVTTPIAVDRLVLAACQRRAHADFLNPPAAVLFKLEVSAGKLADVNAPSVEAVITELYHRIHLREPKATELAHLRQLYLDIEQHGSAQPAKDWATLSCYAVATTMESLFY